MKDVVMISNYWHFLWEKESSRYLTIAECVKEYVNLELITSSFYHRNKQQREKNDERIKKMGYAVTLIDEPGYNKNITFQRIISHKKFAMRVREYLEKRKTPDLIYLFVPSLSLGKEVAEYAGKHSVKLVIDVLDLWPEAFRTLFPIPRLADVLLSSMKHSADYIYKSADEIVAVSQTYVDRVKCVNKKASKGHSVLIGADLKLFDQYAICNKRENDDFIVAYIGMLGKSYDINCVSRAIALLQREGIQNIKFLVMGDGPRREEFEKVASELGIHAQFTGQLPYGDMVKKLVNSDVAVNPIVSNATQSFINKHSDYFAAGIPMINTQEYSELRKMIEDNQCGFNCKNADATDVANAIKKLYQDVELRKAMGEHSRTVAEKYFDRNKTYHEIVEVICN